MFHFTRILFQNHDLKISFCSSNSTYSLNRLKEFYFIYHSIIIYLSKFYLFLEINLKEFYFHFHLSSLLAFLCFTYFKIMIWKYIPPEFYLFLYNHPKESLIFYPNVFRNRSSSFKEKKIRGYSKRFPWVQTYEGTITVASQG